MKKAASMVVNQDWSLLPPDLLDHIVQRIVSISDFIRFRSVCTSWRAAAPPQKLRPQPPLLLHPYDDSTPYRCVFSLATKKDHHLNPPLLQNKQILCSTDGWLLLVDVDTTAFSLLNPVTSAQIHLPSVPSGSFQVPVDCGLLLRDVFDHGFAVLIYGSPRLVNITFPLFCKIGDESWSEIRDDLDPGYSHIIYHRGELYGNNRHLLYTHQSYLAFSHQSETECFSKDDAFALFYNWDNAIAYDCILDIFRSYGTVLFCSDYVVTILHRTLEVKPISLYKLDFDGRNFRRSIVQLKDYAIFNSHNQSTLCCIKDFPYYKEHCVVC